MTVKHNLYKTRLCHYTHGCDDQFTRTIKESQHQYLVCGNPEPCNQQRIYSSNVLSIRQATMGYHPRPKPRYCQICGKELRITNGKGVCTLCQRKGKKAYEQY